MEFQKQTIREKILENGWKITELEKFELDWRANEMWLLESVWSPIGNTAFITFLLEPAEAKEVWEIRVSKEKPDDRGRSPSCSSLSRKGWEKELPEFMNFLADLRNQPSQNVEE